MKPAVSFSSEHMLISHPHQSLAKHLAGVGKISHAALASKQLGEGFLPELSPARLLDLLVYFHDFGKATAIFQYRIIEAAKKENPSFAGLDKQYIAQFDSRPDQSLLINYAQDSEIRSHAILGAFFSMSAIDCGGNNLLRLQIIEIIARHHGNLRNFESGEERSAQWNQHILRTQWPLTDAENYRSILKNTDWTFTEDVEHIIKEYDDFFFLEEHNSLADNKSLLPYFQTLFFFSLLLAGDKGDLMLAGKEMTAGTHVLGSALIDRFKEKEFGPVTPKGINIQRETAYRNVVETLRGNPDNGFYSITLPTGLGKTLTAYNAAVNLQQLIREKYVGKKIDCTPRIIYCLPFTSVIDQNSGILEDILAKNNKPPGILAKHHYLADWPTEKETRDEVIESLTYSQREYLVEGWEYTLTVTTFVQLLETIFSNRNRTLRKFHNLSNAIVILDEVQNIPPKYFEVVAEVFEFIYQKMGTRFIFVTATQPYMMPKGMVVELTDPTLEYTRSVFRQMNRINLDLSLWMDGPDDIDEMIPIFQEAIVREKDKSFLIILNLVRESQQIYEQLRAASLENTTYIYLSSAILPILRKLRIDKIKESREPGERVVVVSTQVVEAGVDIDLDIVYRAEAPLDSINQSAGRCNRNAKRGKGSVRLFKNKGASKIYDQVLLQATASVLNNAVSNTGENIIPESMFLELNDSYAVKIREAVAENNDASINIIRKMRLLHFEDVAKNFKLIKQDFPRYAVFIDSPKELPKVCHDGREMTSTDVWNEMENILKDENLGRWKKKEKLRLLRPALLQYVVQFPAYALPPDYQEGADDRIFTRLTKDGKYNYSICYSLDTGYFKAEITNPPTKSF